MEWNDIQAMFYDQSEITASEYFCVRDIKYIYAKNQTMICYELLFCTITFYKPTNNLKITFTTIYCMTKLLLLHFISNVVETLGNYFTFQ